MAAHCQRRRGLGPRGRAGTLLGEVLADIGGDGRAGAVEIELTGQFIGQEGEVERLAVGQHAGQVVVGGWRPRGLVIAAGRLGDKAGLVLEPLVAPPVELGRAEVKTLGGGQRVKLAGVEGSEDFLDVERWDAMGELWFFIGARLPDWGRCPQAPEVYRFGALVERGSARKQKSGFGRN